MSNTIPTAPVQTYRPNVTKNVTRREFYEIMSRPCDPKWVKRLAERGGILYLPWYNIPLIIAENLPDTTWNWTIVRAWEAPIYKGDRDSGYEQYTAAHVHGRLEFHTTDSILIREAIAVDDDPWGQRGSSAERAEAACMRRAAAKFGTLFGLALYDKDGDSRASIDGAVGGAQQQKKAWTPRPGAAPANRPAAKSAHAPSPPAPVAIAGKAKEPWDQF